MQLVFEVMQTIKSNQAHQGLSKMQKHPVEIKKLNAWQHTGVPGAFWYCQDSETLRSVCIGDASLDAQDPCHHRKNDHRHIDLE